MIVNYSIGQWSTFLVLGIGFRESQVINFHTLFGVVSLTCCLKDETTTILEKLKSQHKADVSTDRG